MTLDVAGSPWIVPLTGTTVNQGVTLTVAQGVVVQFTCDPGPDLEPPGERNAALTRDFRLRSDVHLGLRFSGARRLD
jgi:hypothetical protein